MVVADPRPSFTSRLLVDAGRFFEPDEAFRLLQRVFNYDARTRFCELDPRPPQGTALRALPLVVALLAQPALSSLTEEEACPTCRSELRAFPRRPGSRPRPLQPKPEPLRTAPFERARRTWDARRPNEPEPRRDRFTLAGGGRPHRLAPGGPFSVLVRAPRVVGDACETGWKARSRASTRPHCRPRPPFQHAPAKVRAFPLTEVLFTVGTGGRKGSLPVSPGRSCPIRGRSPALHRAVAAPLLPEDLAWG